MENVPIRIEGANLEHTAETQYNLISFSNYILRCETHITYAFITHSMIYFKVFNNVYFEHFGWQLMKTPNFEKYVHTLYIICAHHLCKTAWRRSACGSAEAQVTSIKAWLHFWVGSSSSFWQHPEASLWGLTFVHTETMVIKAWIGSAGTCQVFLENEISISIKPDSRGRYGVLQNILGDYLALTLGLTKPSGPTPAGDMVLWIITSCENFPWSVMQLAFCDSPLLLQTWLYYFQIKILHVLSF